MVESESNAMNSQNEGTQTVSSSSFLVDGTSSLSLNQPLPFEEPLLIPPASSVDGMSSLSINQSSAFVVPLSTMARAYEDVRTRPVQTLSFWEPNRNLPLETVPEREAHAAPDLT